MLKHPQGFKLIALTGPAGCGKDTLGRKLEALGYRNYAFASVLKAMICQIPGISSEYTENRELKESKHPLFDVTIRQMMRTLGTEWGRDMVDKDIWVKCLEYRLQNSLVRGWGKRFCITDMRFPNEAAWVRANGGIVVHIRRAEVQNKAHEHSSEVLLPTHSEDLIIFNNSSIYALSEDALRIAEFVERQGSSTAA